MKNWDAARMDEQAGLIRRIHERAPAMGFEREWMGRRFGFTLPRPLFRVETFRRRMRANFVVPLTADQFHTMLVHNAT